MKERIQKENYEIVLPGNRYFFVERSIFQTFWKDDCCPDFLFLRLGASDLHHRPGFDKGFQFWTQIILALWLNGT